MKITNQKQELSMAVMLVSGPGRNEHLYRGPSVGASYHVSFILANRFQRRFKCEKLTDDGRQVIANYHIGQVS